VGYLVATKSGGSEKSYWSQFSDWVGRKTGEVTGLFDLGDGFNRLMNGSKAQYYGDSGTNLEQIKLAGESFQSAGENGANAVFMATTNGVGGEARLLTGTVWDSIKATQPVWANTVIPRSFELALNKGAVWVHANASEHLAEYAVAAMNKGMSRELANLGSQMQLASLQAAINAASVKGIPMNTLVNIGGWELKFAQKATDKLPVLIHALPR
jgi:hypothetical protein